MSYSDPQIGESLAVQITSKNPQYGLFVSTPNGISGLIRKLNISWSYQNRFYDSLHVGDYIQAIVTKVHPDGKIELRRKDACANPRDLNLDLILKGTTVQRNYPIGSVDLNRNHSSDVLV